MKLVVTAQGPELSAAVDPRFGRALWFILFDTASGEHTPIDNGEQVAAAQGAGVQAARLVVASGAEALLTGRCGPKAFQVLAAGGVAVHGGASGSVAAAIEDWEAGRLTRLTAPDGTPHARGS